MIAYREVIPLLFEAFPDIHQEFLEDAEANGDGGMVDEYGDPLAYIVFPDMRRRYIEEELAAHGVTDRVRRAFDFIERVARNGDPDARDLVGIEVDDVFCRDLEVRRLMGPAMQFLTLMDGPTAEQVADPLSLLRAELDRLGARNLDPLPRPQFVPPADMHPTSWLRVLAGLLRHAERRQEAGDERSARLAAQRGLDGVTAWERAKAWGLV